MRVDPDMRTSIRAFLFLTVLAGGTLGASSAQAKGTFFLLELNSGVGESPYAGSAPGLSYGASAGLTFRIPGTPLRYHLLGSVAHRSASASGVHAGTPYVAHRSDVDLFSAHRLVVPIWRMLRVYGEVGLGTRFSRSDLDRTAGLGPLSASQQRFLLVTAIGLQARISKHFSVGVRGELVPLGSGPDVATFAADLPPNPNRMSALAQLGVHF